METFERLESQNFGGTKSIKSNLTKRVDEIDSLAEHRLLSMEEWEERIDLETKLENMSREEDLQWK